MTSGVGTIEELSNVITAAPFVINGDPNTYAWTGTAGLSTSTETTPASVVRTNKCVNPSFEDDTTGWSANHSTLTADDEWMSGAGGSESLKVVTDAASNDSFAALTTNLSLTSGHTYTVSATIRLDGDLLQTGTLSSHARRIYVADTAFAHSHESSQAANAEGETRVSVTFTAESTTTYTVRLYNGSGNAGEAVWWDDVLIEEASSEGTYFDGDSFGFDGAITEATGTFDEIAWIDTASELDQIILTRDSNPGVLVFEDPLGRIQIFDADTYRDES